MRDVEIAYSILGDVKRNSSNIIWVLHPFTADTRVDKWWSSLFGKGRLFDPNKYCIVCPNIPGSPYGSISPFSINPDTQEKYYYDFPILSPRDIVDMFEYLRNYLNISKIKILIGPSMGGMLVFQWLVSYPKSMSHAIVIAGDAYISPWMKSMQLVQKKLILLDPSWGDINDTAGSNGMGLARQMAVISYRCYKIFQLSQAKKEIISNKADEESKIKSFDNVDTYLQYQGDKFITRFNAFSYLSLLNMMNLHDVSEGGNLKKVLQTVQASVLIVGIDSDLIFPTELLKKTSSYIHNAMYKEISTVYGHDGFLIENKQIDDILQDYLVTTLEP